MRTRRSSFLQSPKATRSLNKHRKARTGYFSRRQGWLALLLAPLLAIGVAVGAFAAPANAAGTATITVQAGGIRTAATAVSGLTDGVYQAVARSGSPSGGPFVCTMSNGSCSITVPTGFTWNVSAQTPATNYYLNPNLDSGSSSVGTSAPYVFRTNTVNSNLTIPGASLNSVYTDQNNQRFSGNFAQSYDNPAVPQKCGLKIALVLDQSGSMASDNKQTNLKSAANDVITALSGTPSSIGIYTFAKTAPYNNQTQAVTSTATSGGVTTLHNFVNGLDGPSGATNWDAGLSQVGTGFDLVILLTDGNPTTYGNGSADGSNSEFAYVEQGAFSANAIKARGERIVGVGIGINGGEDNLRAVTGPTLNSDYYLASSSSFGDVLKQLATGNCNNTLQIQKQIQNPSGVLQPNSADANGWDFTNTISSGTIGKTATTAVVNGTNGFASVPVSIAAGATPTITVAETLKDGYTLVSAQCKVNGADVKTTVSANAASFTGAANVPITCLFTNKQPNPTGNFSVQKVVNGSGAGLVGSDATFTVNYTSTAGNGTLTVKNDGVAVASSPLPAGTVVTLSEVAPTAVPNGTWQTPTFTPGNTLTIGANTTTAITLTNPITINTGTLSVKKVITGSAAGAVPAGTSFTVDYSYPAGTGFVAGSGTLTVKNDGTAVTSSPLPVGAVVSFTEEAPTAIPGATWTGAKFSPTTVTITKGSTPTAVTLTNTIVFDTNTFSVTKSVSGTGAGLVPSGTSFTVNWSYPAGTGYLGDSGTLKVKNDGVAVNGPQIPVGAKVTLTETAPDAVTGGTWGTPTFTPASPITITEGSTPVAIALDNPITLNTGTFSVTKKVTGTGKDLVPSAAEFTVDYSYPAGTGYPAGSGSIVVKNDGVPVSPTSAIPVGAKVTLSEHAPAAIAGATWGTPTFDPASPITIKGNSTNVDVTLTNPLTIDVGSFSVTKKVTGTGAYLVPDDASFTVTYSYPAGPSFPAGSGGFTVEDGKTATIDGLPTGAVVTLAENAPASVPGGTWGTPAFDSNPITIGNGTTVKANLDNPISEIQPTLQLKKVVAGADVANTNWVLTGTGTGSTTVTNADGGDTAVTPVKVGVDYSLSEAAKAGFKPAGEFTPGDWTCTPAGAKVKQTGAGTATLTGLAAGANVVCTITNTHQNQGVTITKTVTGSTENVDGTWTTNYDVDVANKSAVASATYNLADTLHFGGGITVNSAAWTGPNATSGTWALPSTSATLATGATLAAAATDVYTVTANATVTKAAWTDKTTQCPTPGQGANGGFLNTATVTVNGKDTSASDCAEPGTLTVQKSVVGTPTWDPATGHWTVDYSVVVTNSSAQAQYYNLADAPSFATGVTVSSASATLNGTPISGWDISKPLATNAQIGAGSTTHPVTDTYAVSVIADVSGITKSSTLTCDGSGTGFFNSAVLTTGTIQSDDAACANIPTTSITHTKVVVPGSVTQAADGTWSVQYTITVKNTGTTGGVYSLDDTLRFGTGITAGAASWTATNGLSGAWADPSADAHTVLATSRPLANGATDTYTVSVSGITVPAGVIGAAAGSCPSSPTSNGAFNNGSGLTVNGITTDDADCAAPSNPTFAKHFVSAVPDTDNPGAWTVTYTEKVDNTSGTNTNFYTLSDTPAFADGVSIDGVTVDGAPAAFDGKTATVVGDPTAIAGGATKTYTVVFSVTVGDVPAGSETCSTQGGPGHGFFNAATLTVGSDNETSTDCGSITPNVNPDVTKTVTSTTQNSDGTWAITYDVKVTQPATGANNPGGLSAKYNLSDTLKFGDSITVNSASWAKNSGASNKWAVDFDAAQTFATGTVIKQGATDTYTVTVNADVAQKAVTSGTATCKSVDDKPVAGGFLNTALLTVGSNQTGAYDCSEPSVPTVQKTLSSSSYNADDATWTLGYTLTAHNPGADAARFTLTDDPAALPAGVSTVGTWKAAAADGTTPAPETNSWNQGDTATIAQGSLAAGATYTYTISVKVKVAAASDPQKCGDDTGIVITNSGEITSGKISSDDNACGTVQFYDVGIVKSHSPIDGGAVDSGKNDPIAYKLVVTNNGTTTATGVTVDDPMPAGLTIDQTTLPANADWTFTGTTDTELKAQYVGGNPAGALVAGGESTITFTAIVGTLSRSDISKPFPNIDNTACVTEDGPDQNKDNDCSTDVTKVKSIAVVAQAQCKNNAPLMSYTLTPFNVGSTPTIALIWWTADGYAHRDPSINASDKAALLANGAQQVDYVTVPAGWSSGDPISGTQLWPGAAVDASGNAIAWPGWSKNAAGTWVLDPKAAGYELRGSAVVEMRINPSTAATEVYPPATPNCNPYPPKPTPSSMADTGSNVVGPIGLAGLLLAIGAGLVFWIRRRRADGTIE